MRLKDLDGSFLRFEFRRESALFHREDGTLEEREIDREYHIEVASLSEAQGVQFLCPRCFARNAGEVGTHYIIAWFRGRGVPDTVTPKPGRWDISGHSLEDLTLRPSILLTSGCEWHGYVTSGETFTL